jgi:hypothetical protein
MPRHEFDARPETADEYVREAQRFLWAALRGKEVETRTEIHHPAIVRRGMRFSSLSYTVSYLQRFL